MGATGIPWYWRDLRKSEPDLPVLRLCRAEFHLQNRVIWYNKHLSELLFIQVF